MDAAAAIQPDSLAPKAVELMLQEAKECIAEYLLFVRSQPKLLAGRQRVCAMLLSMWYRDEAVS